MCYQHKGHRDLLLRHRNTESQSGEGWRVLWGSSGPNPPLPQQGHPEQAEQDPVQEGLNISREGDSTTSLGSLLQGSVTLRVKKFFLMFRRNFLCFSLCPLPLVLSLGTTGKNLAPSFWNPPCRYLQDPLSVFSSPAKVKVSVVQGLAHRTKPLRSWTSFPVLKSALASQSWGLLFWELLSASDCCCHPRAAGYGRCGNCRPSLWRQIFHNSHLRWMVSKNSAWSFTWLFLSLLCRHNCQIIITELWVSIQNNAISYAWQTAKQQQFGHSDKDI